MSSKKRNGFTIIEILISVFIIGTVVTGIFGLFVLNIRTNEEAERRVVAVALSNERAEMVRNLPYANVGTQGGIPAGSILQTENIVRNNITYTIRTDIRYVDDPFDGLVTSNPSDTLNIDYKQVRIEVSWSSPTSPLPIVMILQISPPGIEGGTTAGTLIFQALDADGHGIDGASVQLTNTAITPNINITTETDSSGRLVLPGLPPANGSYKLTVSKSGFNTEQTYNTSATFIPNADHAHLSMIAGQVTEKTFAIDSTSTLTINTQEFPLNQPLGLIAYSFKGTKTIGTNNLGELVYEVDQTGTTNSTGTATHTGLIWDSYSFVVNGATTGYDIRETSLLLPVVMNPGSDQNLVVTLGEHQPISLYVSVASPDGLPVDNATVRLFNTSNGYDQILGTGIFGQVYFPGNPDNPTEAIPANGDYTIEISAPGYEPITQTVTIQDTTQLRVSLTPDS